MNLAIHTVRRFANAASAEELLAKAEHRPTKLDPYIDLVNQRWNEGVATARAIHAELQTLGFTGTANIVERYLRPLRPGGDGRRWGQGAPAPSSPTIPKPRRISRSLLTHPEHLTDDDKRILTSAVAGCPHLRRLHSHIRSFAKSMAQRRGHELTAWLDAVDADDLPELRSFATGIRRDVAAVINGLTLEHSSGAVEGNVTRIIMWNWREATRGRLFRPRGQRHCWRRWMRQGWRKERLGLVLAVGSGAGRSAPRPDLGASVKEWTRMPGWSVDVDSARRGGIERARLMLQSVRADRDVLLFVDADCDEVVRLDIESPQRLTQTLGLSHDGTRILLSTRWPDRPETYLVCHELATGRQRSYDGLFELCAAAFSPDGREAAVSASGPDGLAMLAVLDLDTGAQRRLPASARLTSWSSTITWSPDGKFIVVDYCVVDEVDMVAIVDAGSGDLVEAYEGIYLINSSNGVWFDASRLILVSDETAVDTSPFSILDVSDGSLTRFGERRQDGLLQAIVGDALVWTTKGPTGGLAGIEVSDMDGSGRQAIATVSPAFPLERMEIAPAVWTAL